jgi:hypothetical protein
VEFDACYWLLADLCEQTVAMPLAQAWPILDAFNEMAEIGAPRHLVLVDPGTATAGDLLQEVTGVGPLEGRESTPVWVDPAALAADVLRRVAALAVRARSLQESLAWSRVGDLLCTAFPDLSTSYSNGPGSSA